MPGASIMKYGLFELRSSFLVILEWYIARIAAKADIAAAIPDITVHVSGFAKIVFIASHSMFLSL